MSNLHTEDTFMWENKLLDDYETPNSADGLQTTDPLVWRITHQSGPPVSRREAADALSGIDPDVLNEKAAAEIEKDSANPSYYVDWEVSPDWAVAWAMDANGEAFWYGDVPEPVTMGKDAGTWESPNFGVLSAPDFNFPKDRWQSSLIVKSPLDVMVQDAQKLGLYDDYEEDSDLGIAEDFMSLSDDFLAALDAQDDKVNSPSHYNSGNIECIEAIEEALTDEEMRGYFKGNCLKYLWREQYKNGTEDLEKAYWYLGRLIDNLEG